MCVPEMGVSATRVLILLLIAAWPFPIRTEKTGLYVVSPRQRHLEKEEKIVVVVVAVVENTESQCGFP